MELSTLKQIGRFNDIVLTLFKYGFHDTVERIGLPSGMFKREHEGPYAREHAFARVRLMLEELGPTFMKLGQILSMRPDLVPAPLCDELRRLQDQAPAAPYEEVRVMVGDALGRPLELVFKEFDEEPLAAASLGQVHRAVLREEDREVAVKVLKPGMRRTMEQDLQILVTLADLLDGRISALRNHDLPAIVAELRKGLLRELDYGHEVRNMRMARNNLQSMREVLVPGVLMEYCNDRIITMDMIRGKKLDELGDESDSARAHWASVALRCLTSQAMGDGFFHADPHPGNVLFLPEGRVAFLDWGMVGRLTANMRHALVDLLVAASERDSERVVNVLFRLTNHRRNVNTLAVEQEVLDILDLGLNTACKDIHVGQLLQELQHAVDKYGLQFPPSLTMLGKSILTTEGLARRLCPEVNSIAETAPLFKKLAKERYSLRTGARTLRNLLTGFLDLQRSLPERLDMLFKKAEQGEVSVRFKHENLEGIRETLDQASERLALAVILGALFVGSSLLITTGLEPLIFGYPALGVIGFLISGFFGLLLAITIFRRKKF